MDSTGEHQHVFSDSRAGTVRCFLWVGTTDVWMPSWTQGRTKLIAQGINRLGNCRPYVLPHVICCSKILTNLKIMNIISIMNIIDIISIITIIRLITRRHVDGSAWARNNLSNCNKYLFEHVHTSISASLDLGWCTTCCHPGGLRPCWNDGLSPELIERSSLEYKKLLQVDTNILLSNNHKNIQQKLYNINCTQNLDVLGI